MSTNQSHPPKKTEKTADQARAELYETLGQLRERLDYAQRIDDKVDDTKRKIAALKQENPALFIAGAAVAAAAAGLIVWSVARKFLR